MEGIVLAFIATLIILIMTLLKTKKEMDRIAEKEKAARNEIIHSTVSSHQINAELEECYLSPHEEGKLVVAIRVSPTNYNSLRIDECHVELGNGCKLHPRQYTTPRILRDFGQNLIFFESEQNDAYTPEQSITLCITEGRTGKDYQTGRPLPSSARRIVRQAS